MIERRNTLAAPGRIATAELTSVIDPDRPLTVEFSGYVSATALLMDELGGTPLGAPRGWRESVTSGLNERNVAVLRPLVNSRPSDLRSCMCILPHRTTTGRASLEDDMERIVAIPPDLFAAQLPNNRIWDEVVRHPARWLHGFARAVGRACKGMREPWTSAGVFDREAERLGVAAVHSAERELIAARASRLRCGSSKGPRRLEPICGPSLGWSRCLVGAMPPTRGSSRVR